MWRKIHIARQTEKMKKPITGTWFEFTHHNPAEGKYWNPACRAFTEEQWREKVREIAAVGMKYIVLMCTSLVYEDYAESYFKTDIYPFARDFACSDPMEALLSEADAQGISVFVSAGFYGVWSRAIDNMTSPEVTRRAFRAMEQVYAAYGHHPSFYGWYFPDETCIRGHFSPEFIDYCNRYSAFAHSIDPTRRTLIAPFGTRIVEADDEYVRQLSEIDVDIMAYQDEVGVQKSTTNETGAFYAALRRAHDRAGRSAMWADLELFKFEGQVYHSALLPADIGRVERQLEAISEYCDEVLCYQYIGLMNPADSRAFCGHPESAELYRAYIELFPGCLKNKS